MTTFISIKGKNTRMGKMFKTPKHLLLHNGRPAIERTKELMAQFGEVIICDHENTPPDTGIVDMLLQMDLPDNFFVVDCDVIPYKLNPPDGNTVYLFENTDKLDCYSNFKLFHGKVLDCNEKQEVFDWAGAGVYFFRSASEFKESSYNCNTLAQVMAKMLKRELSVKGDTTSEIFRFGSLQTILNNKCS